MKFSQIFMIIIFIVILIGILRLRRWIKQLKRNVNQVLNTDISSLEEFAKYQQEMLAETPKSVSGMTKLMEPQIQKDFPEFSWPQFKARTENLVISYFEAINKNNTNEVESFSKDIALQAKQRIENNQSNRVREIFKNVRIHQMEILNYAKKDGKCIIEIQMSMEYLYYKEKDGQRIEGNQDNKIQTKYNIELVYIQNETDENTTATKLMCPNCGAPIVNLGNKVCEYCRTNVIPMNIHVWNYQRFYES